MSGLFRQLSECRLQQPGRVPGLPEIDVPVFLHEQQLIQLRLSCAEQHHLHADLLEQRHIGQLLLRKAAHGGFAHRVLHLLHAVKHREDRAGGAAERAAAPHKDAGPRGRLLRFLPEAQGQIRRTEKGKTNRVSGAIGKAGVDFKREFTPDTYRQFFADAGYPDAEYTLCEGRIPCAVAVLLKREEPA